MKGRNNYLCRKNENNAGDRYQNNA